MAIGLGSVPTYIGPGFRMFVTGVSGPVPSDDILQVYLLRHSDGSEFTEGLIAPPVAGTNIVTIGWDGRRKQIMDGSGDGMADGTAMDVSVIQRHHDLTVVETIAATPFGVLDTHSYPWALMAKLVAASSADLAEILAAVRTSFPATA